MTKVSVKRDEEVLRLLDQLEELADRLEVRVRVERGDFRSGYCESRGQAMIILNRRLGVYDRALTLARILGDRDLSGVFLVPRVREFIDGLAFRNGSSEGER